MPPTASQAAPPQIDLAAALEAADMTGHHLSVATGIHAATISRYKHGLQMSARDAAKIAEALQARGER
jgi:hypothetical protein